MSQSDSDKYPDVIFQFCGWHIKHSPHLGFDIAGDVVLSCPGAYNYPDPPIKPLEEILDG